MKYNKIIIFGLTASGKTTLAKKISKILKIKIYCTEDLVYKKKWTLKVTKEEFLKSLEKIIKKEKWIIEGVHSEWLSPALPKADLIIFTNPNKIIITKRGLKRSIQQKDNLKEILKILYWINRWGPNWYRKCKSKSKEFIEVKNNNQIKKLLEKLK